MTIVIANLQSKIPIPVSKIRSIAQKSSLSLKLPHQEISIVFVGQQRMRTLNRKFLGHDYVTDVITFGHGEIVVCPHVAFSNSKQYGNSTAQEILLYVIHGLLHLAGYDDHAPKDIAKMRMMEQRLLGGR